jgi:hypothetical protein
MSCEAGRVRRLAAVLLVICLAGCRGLFATQGPPDDPLFLDKKPLESKAQSAPPVAVAYSEPAPPANPYFADERPALAGRPRRPHQLGPVPGTLTSRPRPVEPQDETDPPPP